mgnify:CR=1 FL=1
MKTEMKYGVFKFRDDACYKQHEVLKEFSAEYRAEVFADKCWAKKPVYGGYVVRTLATGQE